MERFERALFHLLERNQETRFSVHDDFFDTADCAGYNRGFACHCFEIDDAEGLVNRWAAKYCRVRIKFGNRIPIDHLCDPDNVGALFHCALDGVFHFLPDLRRIGRASTKHDLKIGVHILNGTHEIDNSFLSRDPADEKQEGFIGIDSMALERGS